MSEKRTYRTVAKPQRPDVLPGLCGACLPYVFDRPTPPGHRAWPQRLASGAAPGRASIDEFQVTLRAEADRRRALSASATTALQSLWQALLKTLCRLGGDAVARLVSGYGSQITLPPTGLSLLAWSVR